MQLKVFERVAGRPGCQARLSAGQLHLVISIDGPRTLRAVHFDPGLVPPILDTTAAAKLVGEAADITRFKSRDAYAMWAGTAPIPVWSANNQRFRLNRGGNRQTTAAIHRIAIAQIRIHPTLNRSSPGASKERQPNEKPYDYSNENWPTSPTGTSPLTSSNLP